MKQIDTSDNVYEASDLSASVTLVTTSQWANDKSRLRILEPLTIISRVNGNLTYKPKIYNVTDYSLPGGIVTCPEHMVPLWRTESVNPNKPTIIELDIENKDYFGSYAPVINEGDIIAVFDSSNKFCLDICVWNNNGGNKLVCSQNITSNYGIQYGSSLYFQVYRANVQHKGIEALQVRDATRLDGNNNVLWQTSDSNAANYDTSKKIIRIDDGATSGLYTNVKFMVCDLVINLYHRGIKINLTGGSALKRFSGQTQSLIKTQVTIPAAYQQYSESEFDITYYSNEHPSFSNYAGEYGSQYETDPWDENAVAYSSGFISQVTSGISNVSNINYITYGNTSTTTEDIALFNYDSEQVLTFNHGEWTPVR